MATRCSEEMLSPSRYGLHGQKKKVGAKQREMGPYRTTVRSKTALVLLLSWKIGGSQIKENPREMMGHKLNI